MSSKPPFIIPTSKGTQAWPEATRTPPKMTVEVDPQNLTPEQLQLAQEITDRQLAEKAGAIKQAYLRFQQTMSTGIADYNCNKVNVAPGIKAQFVQNGPHERIAVRVKAAEVLAEPPPEVPQPMVPFYILVAFKWEELEADFECGVRIKEPLISPTVGAITEWFFTGTDGNPYTYDLPDYKLIYNPGYDHATHFDSEDGWDFAVIDPTVFVTAGVPTVKLDIMGVYDTGPEVPTPVDVIVKTIRDDLPKSHDEAKRAAQSSAHVVAEHKDRNRTVGISWRSEQIDLMSEVTVDILTGQIDYKITRGKITRNNLESTQNNQIW